VIDSLVRHFMRCHDDERQMPVVWHQTLLCFVQRYKDDIRQEDKTLLRKLTQVGGGGGLSCCCLALHGSSYWC
jgi:essential nuclear protein 1